MIDRETGAKQRGRFKTLKLDELSAVDRPAQEGALVMTQKRATNPTEHTAEIIKYIDGEDGIKTFQELLAAREKKDRFWEAQEALWPALNSVNDSITSICADTSLSPQAKSDMIRSQVEDFLVVVREKSPEIEEEIAKFLKAGPSGDINGEPKMTDAEKIADLAKQVETLTAKNAEITAKMDAAMADMEEKDKTLDDLKKSASDEIFKSVSGASVSKAAVGDAVFSILKAQDAEIRKAQEERDIARFEKQADDQLGHLPGTSVEKASILKAASAMPEDARKALDTILKAADEMAAGAFKNLGRSADDLANIEKAAMDFTTKVAEIEKSEGVPHHTAMSKARSQYPNLYKSAYPDRAA